MKQILIVLVSLVAAGAACAPALRAQGLEVHVTYVSADYVYLDAGREHGIHVGDSLVVRRGGLPLGRLLVSGTSRARSVTSILGPPFPVAVGDSFFVEVRVPSEVPTPAPRDTLIVTPPVAPRESILSRLPTGVERVGSERRRLRVTGRLRLDLSAMRTETRWRSSVPEKTTRSFYNPGAALRLGVAGLPGGWDLGMDASLTRRYSTNDIVSPQSLARIYRISLLRRATGFPLEIEAGRFQPSGDPARTYWDGMQLTWKQREFSAGIAAGLEPDRFNGFVQTGVPKAAAFVEASWRVGSVILTSNAGGAFVRPTNGWLDHSYAGFAQGIRFGKARFTADVQIDEDPESGTWSASRFYLRANIPIAAGLGVSGRFQERRPYAYWRTADVVGTRRTQEAISISWDRRAWSVQAGWTGNTAEAGVSSDTWATSFSLARIPILGASFVGSASLWRRAGFDSRYLTAALSRRVPGGRVTASWQRYAFTGSPSYASSNTAGLQWAGTLGRSLSASLGGRMQFGSQTSGVTANGSITFAF